MKFTEDFLHYIWKFRLYNIRLLQTTNNEPVEILSAGVHNHNAGPDFENAKIRISGTVWAGNVEIHLYSSDWHKHDHSTDPAYDSIILHVVYDDDQPVRFSNGNKIPTIVLKNIIPENVFNRYGLLMHGLNWIPCEKQLPYVDSFHIDTWLSRMIVERLEAKSKITNHILQEYQGSWDDAFYILMAKNFGFKVNAVPFEMLARSLPQTILAKHKNSSLQIEALIFGQSGFLSDSFSDAYPLSLQTEYRFLQKKYGLKPLEKFIWKFSRLRPQNFPTVRLAQFAALIVKSSHLFSKVLEINDAKGLKNLLEQLPVNNYWEDHYHFEKSGSQHTRQLGKDSCSSILINTISVALFTYGRFFNKERYINRALNLLENTDTETNQVIRRFKNIGVISERAYTSQAILQLKSSYCDHKKCLNCGIGIKIMSSAV